MIRGGGRGKLRYDAVEDVLILFPLLISLNQPDFQILEAKYTGGCFPNQSVDNAVHGSFADLSFTTYVLD